MGTTKNLIYLYVSDRPCGELDAVSTSGINYRSDGHINKFEETAKTDGVIKMLDLLASMHYFENVFVFIDTRQGIGTVNLSPRTKIITVPNMKAAIENYLNKEDIIMVRGGFKAWLPLLTDLLLAPNWVLFYRANTNSAAWPYWDIILDDLQSQDFIFKGRCYYPFKKPINEDIFKLIEPQLERNTDLCIGASHIHRKKGQVTVVKELLINKRRNWFKNIIIPGGFIRCMTNTSVMSAARELPIQLPGHVSKLRLAEIFNQTGLYIHAGTSGQNDRSLLEALCCGVPSCVIEPRIFPSFITQAASQPFNMLAPTIFSVKPYNLFSDLQKIWAKLYSLGVSDLAFRKEIRQWYLTNNGLTQVALPSFVNLLNWLDGHTKGEFREFRTSVKRSLFNWVEATRK
jgi:hypothetical protein